MREVDDMRLAWRPSGTDGRTRRCTCPVRRVTMACVRGHLIEEHPYLVEPDLWVPWDYEPAGPFRLQRWHESAERAHQASVATCSAGLFETVDLFVSRMMPPIPGWYGFVIDERFKLVLGYSASRYQIERAGTSGWFGVAAAYEHLTPLVGDPMTVAIWESMARSSAR